MYKVVMRYPDGSSEEEDEIFETEAEAQEHGIEQVSNFRTGGEVLHMSNPGDYPLDDEDADFDVVEIEV